MTALETKLAAAFLVNAKAREQAERLIAGYVTLGTNKLPRRKELCA
jgi:hypothetical protein